MARILVVDDDVFVALLISLELPDVTLVEASRLSDGYELAISSEPDGIVIDRRLPDGDGLDLVRQLRMTRATSQTPIVLLTAGHDEADRAQVMRVGADEYLAKPFDPVDLLARLERVLHLPPSDRKPRRASIISRVRDGLPPDSDPSTVIDLTDPAPDTRVGGGLFARWRSRNAV